MPKIETIFSPALFSLYENGIEQKTVVVTDILRATTTICLAFENGAEQIVAVSEPSQAAELRDHGFIAAAERHGEKVEGFELGNSPQEYTPERISGKKIAFTTTNGTRALAMSENAYRVLVGSFLNIGALVAELLREKRDVMVFCAGWKDKFNLEDTLFAGALIEALKDQFEISGDASQAALDLYRAAKDDMATYLEKASHVQRFKTLHVESDIQVCLKMNLTKKIPVYSGGIINLLHHERAHH